MCYSFSITTNKWYTHKCINFIMLLGAQAFVHVKRLVLSHCALVWLTSGGLGFWWILRPCLPWFVRFSDLLLCCFFCFLFWFSIWVHGGLFGSLIWIVGCFLGGWWQYFEWLVVFWWLASLPYMEFWVMGDGDLCNCACIWRVENYAKFSLLPWNKHWKMISIVFSSWQPNMV